MSSEWSAEESGQGSGSLSGLHPREVWQPGDPDLHPERIHILLPRTAGMEILEKEYKNHALYATIFSGGRPISGEELLAAITETCGNKDGGVRIEVASPPHSYFLIFSSTMYCTRVLNVSTTIKCGGDRVEFCRWSNTVRGQRAELAFKTRICLEGLPDTGLESGTYKVIVAAFGGNLIDVLPQKDQWTAEIDVWLRDPNKIPKKIVADVPFPDLGPWQPDSDNEGQSPPPVSSPRRKLVDTFTVNVHLKSVSRNGRLHVVQAWRGQVDGSGPSIYGPA